MAVTILLFLVIGVLMAVTLQYRALFYSLQKEVYDQGLHLLSTVDDKEGVYRCLDSELVVSIGIYLVTLGKKKLRKKIIFLFLVHSYLMDGRD